MSKKVAWHEPKKGQVVIDASENWKNVSMAMMGDNFLNALLVPKEQSTRHASSSTRTSTLRTSTTRAR